MEEEQIVFPSLSPSGAPYPSQTPTPYPNGSSSPVPTTATTTTKPVGSGGFNWFALVGGLFTPKTAGITPIAQPSPISAEQQRKNQQLFIIAIVIMLLVLGVAVWYFLKS